ncbi:T9SS type A sorting domain-containing protein [Pedobacter cryoconitis]|uniref:Secretion system C-terminal sorting domain-containing protein n=1 Tax=Pedobacter cryoconitis TaxID=188932 RepID=A0A7X0J551_9SPHI|nr:T9SS type A sorting domain-containing protein [Pedobacter cryoconitis]MBB6500844.1 hypothetical protein [Pedobacter cryoconitis]
MRANIYLTITSIFSLLIPVSLFGQGMTISSGAYVIANNGNLITYQNFTNNGSFTQNGGSVIFAGTTQTLNGTTNTTFTQVNINTGSTTTVGSSQQIGGILLSNGSLNANGNLTLLSTATQTSLIDGTGTGSVTGNLTMQRYLAAGFGYKYFSSPFTAATVNAFSSTVNLAAAFPNFYTYIENQPSSGWTNYSTTTNVLNPLQGYAADFGALTAQKLVTITGVVNNGSLSATLYNHNQPYTLGFNLVGNPYPSPIDWNASSGWTKTNVDNAIYYFDSGSTSQYTGTYSSYINNVSSDGIANNVIASMQGFFVHVSSGSYPVTATLAMTNAVRVNNLSPVFHKTSSLNDPSFAKPRILLRLSAGYAGSPSSSDPLVVYTEEIATTGFDSKLDAIKLMNTSDQAPNLYSIATDATKLAINALPSIDTNTVIPLVLNINQGGLIDFTLRTLENLPLELHAYLSDAKTGTNQLLEENKTSSIQLSSGDYNNRFSIRFKPLKTAINPNSSNDIFNVYGANGKLTVYIHLENEQKGDLVLVNLLGQILSRQKLNGNGTYEIDANVASGIYIVSFISSSSIHSKKLFLN